MKKVSREPDQAGLVKIEMENIGELDSDERMFLKFVMRQNRRLRAGESFMGGDAAGVEIQEEDPHRQPKS